MMDPLNYRQQLELFIAMTDKEFRVRYKRAVFGLFWVVLNPLLQMLIIGLVFSSFVNIPNYFLFLLSGLLPWQFFSLSLSKATPSFVYDRQLLQKARFVRAFIPLSIVTSNLINLLAGLLLTGLISIFLYHFHWYLLLIIPAVLWLYAFTCGISLLTASLNVRFRDITFFIQSILIIWFYVTPIIYAPANISPKLIPLLTLNPLTTPIELFHLAFTHNVNITPNIFFLNLVLSLSTIFLGIIQYKKENNNFVDWL